MTSLFYIFFPVEVHHFTSTPCISPSFLCYLHAWQRKSKWKVFHSSARYNVCNEAGAYFLRSGLQQRHKQKMGLPKQ